MRTVKAEIRRYVIKHYETILELLNDMLIRDATCERRSFRLNPLTVWTLSNVSRIELFLSNFIIDFIDFLTVISYVKMQKTKTRLIKNLIYYDEVLNELILFLY